MIEGGDAVLGGLGDAIQEEVKPTGQVMVVPDAGEAFDVVLQIG